ncbi:MAG: hypothetical protein P9L94_10670 [Candidatus Hinthialibacter antarcticus]|nr:hypothetical protein [Candidatus Hinthialibacter antarcticus]
MLWFGFSFLAGFYGAHWRLFDLAQGARSISIIAFISLCALAGGFIYVVYSAAARSASPGASVNLPLATGALLAYSAITGLAHFWGWVPLPLAAVIASPCILLPPFIYFIRPVAAIEQPAIVLSMEENCRVKDRALSSTLIRQFCERYPDSNVYIYRTGNSYTVGGLLFHNRERLNVIQTTWLDVTLDCPFSSTMGVLAEGRESFSAYMIRPKESKTAVYAFPTKDWEEWRAGFTQQDWMERIQNLDALSASHPPLGGHPFQLIEKKYTWQVFPLHD